MTRWIVLMLMAVTLPGCGRTLADNTTDQEGPAMVGLWITRWDFKRPADVRRVIADAAELGATDVFFQVRGQADALYPSEIEPWSELLLEDLPEGTAEPGFDPLARAIEQAHQRGMKLHAWVNVMPLWKGTTPPSNRAHPFYTHGEFRLVGRDGQPQPLNDHYVTVNPVLPTVHEHILAVIGDIARKYPVDGIHLDYIRFIAESADAEAGYPADATSHALFRAAKGMNANEHPEAYRSFIAGRITELVGAIRRTVKAARPNASLTAAVWRNPMLAGGDYLQRYDVWAKQGLLDALLPMIYTADDAQFRSDLQAVLGERGRAAVYAGIGVYKHENPQETVRQIERSLAMGADGVCLFAYESLFESVNPEQDRSPEARALRAARLKAVRTYLHSHSAPAAAAQDRP